MTYVCSHCDWTVDAGGTEDSDSEQVALHLRHPPWYLSFMDRDRSDELTSRMPIVPHEAAGVACCGCIVAAVEGSNVELRCNECGAVVGVIQIDVPPELPGWTG